MLFIGKPCKDASDSCHPDWKPTLNLHKSTVSAYSSHQKKKTSLARYSRKQERDQRKANLLITQKQKSKGTINHCYLCSTHPVFNSHFTLGNKGNTLPDVCLDSSDHNYSAQNGIQFST